MASLNFMSYAEIDFAIVPAAPPAWKNWRATSCPAPISANVPYLGSSRLMVRALRFVVRSSEDSLRVDSILTRGWVLTMHENRHLYQQPVAVFGGPLKP